jgi:hypothetical protein
MECANHECQQLGFTDVASTDLLGQCAAEYDIRGDSGSANREPVANSS